MSEIDLSDFEDEGGAGAPEADSPGLDLSDFEDEDQTSQLLNEKYNSSSQSPDDFAKAKSLADKTGLPMITAMNQRDKAEKIANRPDWDGFSKDAPVAARSLANDGTLFQIAHDDHQSLSAIEQGLVGLGTKPEVTTGDRAHDHALQLASGLAMIPKAGIGTADFIKPVMDILLPGQAAAWGLLENTVGDGSETYTSMMKKMGVDFAAADAAAEDMMSPASKYEAELVNKAFDQGLIDGGVALVQNPTQITESVTKSLPSMITMAMGTRVVAKGIFDTALATAEASGVTGQAALDVARAAVTEAMPYLSAVSAGVEGLQSGGDVASDYAADGDMTLRDLFATGGQGLTTALIGVVSNKIGGALGLEDIEASAAATGLRDRVGDMFSNILKGAVKEGPMEEGLQSAAETAWSNFGSGREITDGTGRSFIEGSITGTAIGAGMNAVTSSAEIAIHKLEQKRLASATEASETQAKLIQSFNDVSGSLLGQRDKKSLQQLMDAVAEDEGNVAPTHMLISADAFKQGGIDPEAFKTAAPSVADQVDQAIQLGGTISVPVGELFTGFAGTGMEQTLTEHMKVSEDAWTAFEASQTKQQDALDQFAVEAEKIRAEQTDRQAWDAQAKVVYDGILSDLNRSETFDKKVNQAYATLVRDFYSIMAPKLGMTPDKLFEKDRLRVGVARGDGPVLNQPGNTDNKNSIDTGARQGVDSKSEVTDYDNSPKVQLQSRVLRWADSVGLHGRTSIGTVGSGFTEASLYKGERSGKVNPFISEDERVATAEEGRAEQDKLIATAKENGFFLGLGHPFLEELESHKNYGGMEHDAYIVGEAPHKIVIRNTINGEFGHASKHSPVAYLKRIEYYNKTFPDLRIDLIGVHENADGNVEVWTAQAFAPGAEFETENELDAAMRKHGWYAEGISAPGLPKRYKNKDTGAVISDVHPGNILHDGDKLYPIDVIVEKLPRQVFNQSTWYRSALLDAAQNLKQEKGTPDQMLAILSKTPGVKPAEIEATGLPEYLQMQGKSVTKQQIIDYLAGNGVQVQETMLGAGDEPKLPDGWTVQYETEAGEYVVRDEDGEEISSDDTREAAILGAMDPDHYYDDPDSAGGTKFGQYVLPGGKNYRELLLTLPVKMNTDKDGLPLSYKLVDEGDGRWSFNSPVLSSRVYKSREEAVSAALKDAESEIKNGIGDGVHGFRSSHFDQPNILAHVRFNERTDSEGKKVLFIEEIQSDWAQAGRKEGFSDGSKRVAAKADRREGFWHVTDQRGDFLTNIQDWETKAETEADAIRIANARADENKVGSLSNPRRAPAAPFVTSTDAWVGLSMKRMIAYAAENGFDRIAWTTGEQQADRYDLSKTVDAVDVHVRDGKRHVRIDVNGQESIKMTVGDDGVAGIRSTLHMAYDGKKLDEIIGKDLADKVMAVEEGDQFTGEDLKVGGTGMKSFYDNIVPKVAKEITKKMGGKLTAVQIVGAYNEDIRISSFPDGTAMVEGQGQDKEFDTVAEAEAYRNELMGAQQQPGFDITPEMRDAATGGLALFQNKDGNRAEFNPENLSIGFLENADLSSFLHETGHFFLEMYSRYADQSAEVAQDMEHLLSWFGIAGENGTERRMNWNSMTLDQQRIHHEKFAESFEQYLFEGKAPSVELQSLFDTFGRWLTSVYKSIASFLASHNGAKLTPEVRGVMDRMIATQEQILEVAEVRASKAMFTTQKQSGMTDAQWKAYQEDQKRSIEQPITELTGRSLRDMQYLSNAKGKALRKLQREAEGLRRLARMDARRDVLTKAEYRAWLFLKRKTEGKPIKREKSKQVDPDVDSLFVAIAKLGGLDRSELSARYGYGANDFKGWTSGVFGKPVVRKDGGMALDEMARDLVAYGYMQEDENGRTDTDELDEMLFREVSGDKVYSMWADYDYLLYGDRVQAPDQDSVDYVGGRLDRAALVDMYGKNNPDVKWERPIAYALAGYDNKPQVEEKKGLDNENQISLFDEAGNTAPAKSRKKTKKSPGDVEPTAGLPGRFATTVGNETFKQINAGFEKLDTPEKVAFATSHITKNPQEVLLVLVTDKNHKPISILRHAVGMKDSSSVDVGIVSGWAVNVPGGAHVWISHNHPSGKHILSQADVKVSSKVDDLLRGTHLQSHGIMAVTHEGVFGWNGDYKVIDDGVIPEAEKTVMVDVVERELKTTGRLSSDYENGIGDQNGAIRAVLDVGEGRSGLMLLDAQYRPIGFVPVDFAKSLKIRGEKLQSDILGALEFSNAVAAISFSADNSVDAEKGLLNVGALIEQALVRPLDVLMDHGHKITSWATDSMRLAGSTFKQSAKDGDVKPEGANAITGNLDKVNKDVRNAVESRMARMSAEERARVESELDKFKGTAWAAAAVKGMAYREMLERAMNGEDISNLTTNAIWGKQDMANTKIIKAAKMVPIHGKKAMLSLVGQYDFVGGNRKAENDVSTSFTNCNPSEACAVHCYAAGSNARPSEIAKSEFTEMMLEMFPEESADRIAMQYGATFAVADGLSLRLNDKGDLSDAQVNLVNALNKRDIAVQVFSKRPELLRKLSDMNLKMLSVDSTNIDLARDNPDLRLAVTITDELTEDMVQDIYSRVSVYLPVNLKGKEVTKEELKVRFPNLFKEMKKELCPVDGGKAVTVPGTSFVSILINKNAPEKAWTCTSCDKTGAAGCYRGDRKTATRKAAALHGVDAESELSKARIRKDLQDGLDKLLALGGIDEQQYKQIAKALSSGERAAREIAPKTEEGGVAGQAGGSAEADQGSGSGVQQNAGGSQNLIPLKNLLNQGDKEGDGGKPARTLEGMGMVSNEGLHPDVVADLFGLSSGDELVRKLLAIDDPMTAINKRTDDLMMQRHSEFTDPKTMERMAEAAIHNEARVRFVATELAMLNKAMGGVNVILKAAKMYAAEIISGQKIADIRPAKHAADAARAGREADRMLAKGKTADVVMAKRNQVLHTEAARQSYEAQAEVDKGLGYFKRLEKAINNGRLDPDYGQQIIGLLERYDLRKSVSLLDLERRDSLSAWVQKQQDQGFEPVIPDYLLQDAAKTHYKRMTVDEFRDLIDAVKNIEHLGRLKHSLVQKLRKRQLAAASAEIGAAIEDNAKNTIRDKLEKNSIKDRAADLFNGFLYMHRKFSNLLREMDGWKDGGVLWDYFGRTMNDAGDTESKLREDATIAIDKLMQPLLKSGGFGLLPSKKFIPEINDSLSREGRIMVALNWGNDGNRQRLLDGDGWSPEQVGAILKTLKRQDWEFVQGTWDFLNTYRDQVGAQQKRLTGVEPKWVEPAPFELMTADGHRMQLTGGYFPAKYDADRSTKSLTQEALNTIMDLHKSVRAKTRDSFTKGRAAQVKDRPLRKDFGVIFGHITEVSHRLAWQDWLTDSKRLMVQPDVDSALRAHYGPQMIKELQSALDDIAAGEVGPQNEFESAINHLRTGATVAGLGYNLMTSLMQPLGLTQSMARIGSKWVAKGLAKWRRMDDALPWIYERSDMMRLRGKTMQREINEVMNQVRSPKRAKLNESFFFLIQKGQMIADIPTWLGAFEKATAEGNDEARAAALADQAVLDAQSGGMLKDLARVQRGSSFQKLFTMFMSYFNATYNLSVEAVKRTDFKDTGSVMALGIDYLLLYTLPAAIVTVMKAALTGGDDDELANQLVTDQITYMMGTLVGLREFSSVVSGFNGYTGPAGTRFFSEAGKLAKQIEQGEADAAFWKALNNTGGILLHYPSGQINKTLSGASALLNDETDNPMALLFGSQK